MNLSELLSSEERTRILRDVICLDGPIIASPIARKLKISKSLLSVYLKILENNRIIVRKDGKMKALQRPFLSIHLHLKR